MNRCNTFYKLVIRAPEVDAVFSSSSPRWAIVMVTHLSVCQHFT